MRLWQAKTSDPPTVPARQYRRGHGRDGGKLRCSRLRCALASFSHATGEAGTHGSRRQRIAFYGVPTLVATDQAFAAPGESMASLSLSRMYAARTAITQ